MRGCTRLRWRTGAGFRYGEHRSWMWSKESYFRGQVINIQIGKESGERLYLVEYEDGEMAHMDDEELAPKLYPLWMDKTLAEGGRSPADIEGLISEWE